MKVHNRVNKHINPSPLEGSREALDSPKLERYLTIPELAKRGTIPLGKTKLYELAKIGKIRSYRVGKKILVKESEVHADIQRRFGMRLIHGNAS